MIKPTDGIVHWLPVFVVPELENWTASKQSKSLEFNLCLWSSPTIFHWRSWFSHESTEKWKNARSAQYRKIPWSKPKFLKILYCREGQETTGNGNQALQSSWLYAKQASAVKTLTAINWSCWVKFFPCPINYWTVNFVFVPARHSSFRMTALSIKGSVVTAVQRVLRTQG